MTGTQIAYYFICKRKLWLFSNQIDMEQNDENVSLGKFISENTYERKKHEIKIDNIVLDFFDRKTKIIHEIKKSAKMEEAHLWQVKYYISVLESKGIDGVTGKIDYPKLRQTIKVELTDKDRLQLVQIEKEITGIMQSEKPSEVINKSFCKNCAYYDLCYV